MIQLRNGIRTDRQYHILTRLIVTPLVFMVTVAWALTAARAVWVGPDDNRLDVYWIDTEGGAATLIVTPAGESILIDTGNPGNRDAGRIVKVLGEAAGLRRIDHLIITHYHRDHYGGAATLATMVPIGNVYDNGRFEDMPDDPGKAYFEFECENRVVISAGDRLSLRQTDDTKIEMICLGARQRYVAPEEVDARANEGILESHRDKDRDGSDNANSVVTLLSFGQFRFFDGGDLTWNQELKLVYPFDLIGPVDVYQVSHHGLDSSNNPVVLETIRPTVAIMNNGHRKGCMPEVFANLQATESLDAIYQVHKNLREDGVANNVDDKFIANHLEANACRGHYVKLSVSPDGSEFTVSIPASDHSATYQTTEK